MSIAFCRLITPADYEEIKLKTILRGEKDSEFAAATNSSYGLPVQGIANATSGYLSVNDPDNDSRLFYIFYSCRNLPTGVQASSIPIIVWLQGGPGGSSLIGNFFESGPYRIVRNGTSKQFMEQVTQYSWNDYYNLLYIDNPRGTGYSIASGGDYDTNEDQIAQDMINALNNFYQLSAFTQYQKTPLYIMGESFAGHYVPSIGSAIINYNKGNPSFVIPLAGLAVGDGWTDPINQLVYNDLFAYSLGIVDDVEKARVTLAQTGAVKAIQSKAYNTALGLFGNMLDTITNSGGGLNVYNFRDFGGYDFGDISDFLNQPDTCTRYNIPSNVCGQFQSENMNVYEALINDFFVGVVPAIQNILNNSLPIMFYNGQDDIICNSPNQQNWISNVSWAYQSQFYNQGFDVWIYQNGTIAGLHKQTQNLTFVIVNKAGHLAPYDQINTTTEMLRRFTSGSTNWTNPLSQSLNYENDLAIDL